MARKTRIVLKVGTSMLCDGERLDSMQFGLLAALIADLRVKFDVILVSSGAIASGYTQVKLDKSILANRQALASVGQPLLMDFYRNAFKAYDIVVSQMLLVGKNFDSRQSTECARNTINALLDNDILPIINENDSVAIKEIVFGDNDRLSASVAHYFDANMLIILSDIDGYFDKNPHEFSDAKLLNIIYKIDESALQENASPHTAFSTGGIVTKLQAAHFLMQNNKAMFLSHGKKLDILRKLLLEKIQLSGSLFCKAGASLEDFIR